jgi:hypothetical protein
MLVLSLKAATPVLMLTRQLSRLAPAHEIQATGYALWDDEHNGKEDIGSRNRNLKKWLLPAVAPNSVENPSWVCNRGSGHTVVGQRLVEGLV